MAVTLARAVSAQVPALCAIERAAVELFRGHRAWHAYAAMAIPPELLEVAVTRGLVWVALEEGTPVGFVWLQDGTAEGAVEVAEIDVLPSHGRRGIGAALLEHACAWARAAGFARVDLGTLADVPWNAPFYAKHGLATVDKTDPSFARARERARSRVGASEVGAFTMPASIAASGIVSCSGAWPK